MYNEPVEGMYFIVTSKSNHLFLICKIVKQTDDSGEIWEVKIFKTNIRDYKNCIGSNRAIFLHNNNRVHVEYFKHEYEVLAKVI